MTYFGDSKATRLPSGALPSETGREPTLMLFKGFLEQGFLAGKVNGREADFENPPELEKNLRHDIDVRLDRLLLHPSNRQRLTEAIETGLRLGGGSVAVESVSAPKPGTDNSEEQRFKTKEGSIIPYSEEFACPEHGAFLPEMSLEYSHSTTH